MRWGWLAICVVAGLALGASASLGVYLERSSFANWGFADVYITAFDYKSIVTQGLPVVIGLFVAAPLAELATGGAFRSMWNRVDRRQYLISSMVKAAVSGFVVAFSAMITISLLVWAMTAWGSGFIFAVDADHIEGYYSPQIEAAAWDRLGGIPALFAQVSPGISLFVMSLWVGFSGAIFGLFAAVLALLVPWPRLAFLGPVIWFQFCLLATGSMLSPIGWVSPHDALYPWNLSLLLIPGRVVGLAMYTAPLIVGIWFIFRRTERIASMQ